MKLNNQYLELTTPYVLSPNAILKNRLVIAPMTTYSGCEDGRVSEESLLITVEGLGGRDVHHGCSHHFPPSPQAFPDR